MLSFNKLRLLLLLCLGVVWLSACSNRWAAPVEDRDSRQTTIKSEPKKIKSRPATHIVSSGDSLYSIGFRYGLDYHQLASWNQISAPYKIYPGQKLHLKPGQSLTTKPLAPRPAKKVVTKTPAKTSTKISPVPKKKPTVAVKPKPSPVSKSSSANRKIRWQWPTNGKVIQTYRADDPGRKGIDIAGRDGQSIRSAASGLVVYSGNGLLGYGELIIVKHSDKYLSAYAHNRKRLVTEGEKVQAGQKIAEMGRGVDGRIKLHFEIRVNGKPNNPQQFLPRR